MPGSRLLLIDANSLINRAFFGLYGRQNLTAPDGTPTGALFAFFNMYLRFFDELKPTHVLAAFDRSEPTFRHEMYEQYKGTRKPMPDDLAVQMPLLRDMLDAMEISRVEMAGYEADDLIGTYARIAASQDYEVVILTGDKDSFQLINERVTVIQPVTKSGKTENERYDREAVVRRYGISPEQFVDLKAIMGDPSDNIPGVKGIGEKGAMALITEYSSLENIYASLDHVKKSLADKLAASKDMAFLSRKLSQICEDAPVDQDITPFVVKEPDPVVLLPLLNQYGFKTLIDRLGLQEAPATDEQIEDVRSGLPLETWSEDTLRTYLDSMADIEKEYAPETDARSGAPRDERLVAIELDAHHGAVMVLPDHRAIHIEDAGAALMNFAGRKITIAFFDLKRQLRDLDLDESDLNRLHMIKCHDVMISGYLLNDMDGRPDWPRLFERLTGESYPEEMDQRSIREFSNGKPNGHSKPVQMDLLSPDLSQTDGLEQENSLTVAREREAGQDNVNGEAGRLALGRLAGRVARIRQAALVQIGKTIERGIEQLTWQVEMPLTPVLAAMERTGFTIDERVLDELNGQFSGRLTELQDQIFSVSGHPFNLNSPKQLGDVLFNELGLKTGKRKSSGAYSTDAEELERLSGEHPVIPLIIEHRMLAKLRSTFVEGLAKLTDPVDRRVHTTLNQAATATGRLSSTEPNLQNIPIRMSEGIQIRRAFIAPEGSVLLDADYSQIELRLLAHLSGDEDMVRAFVTGEDIHVNTAAGIFQVSPEQVTKEMRAIAKTVNFSIVYGISDFGLARDLGIMVKDAHRYIAEYHERYPGVRAYLDRLVADAYENGYVETLLGRRRYIHELKSPNRNLRNFGERAAMNTPVQGTAADLIKIAMVQTERSLRAAGLSARLILQVHDELIVEAPLSEAETASRLLKQAMETAMRLDVPLLAEVHQAQDWYDCKTQD